MLFKSYQASTSLEKSLSRITLIFQLVGIQYFSLSSDTLETSSRTNGLSRKFKLILVANTALTISEFCAILFAIHLSDMQPKNGNASGNAVTGQIVQFASYIFMVVVLVTTTLNSFFLREKTRQIFKNCKVISKTLFTLNQCVDYGTFVDEFKRTFAKLSIAFIASTCGTLIFIFQSNHMIVFLWAILAIYPYFITVTVFSYWTFLIRLIRENLRFVKECLVQLQKNAKLYKIDSDPRNRESKLRRNNETYHFFVKLKRIYGVIYETSSVVNELIAVPICLLIIFIGMCNVSSGYKVFLSFRNDVPVERVAVPIYTIFITLISLCTLIFSCSSTYATTDEVLTQVHKFECSKLDRDCEISSILTEFSMLIVQRPIEFTVGGFCYLTQPLLATIITGVTTYVMLLVQFSTS